MTVTSRLAQLASLMALSTVEAVALPTVIDVAARKVGMTAEAFVTEAERNLGLRAYLTGACAKGAQALIADAAGNPGPVL